MSDVERRADLSLDARSLRRGNEVCGWSRAPVDDFGCRAPIRRTFTALPSRGRYARSNRPHVFLFNEISGAMEEEAAKSATAMRKAHHPVRRCRGCGAALRKWWMPAPSLRREPMTSTEEQSCRVEQPCPREAAQPADRRSQAMAPRKGGPATALVVRLRHSRSRKISFHSSIELRMSSADFVHRNDLG